MSRGNEQIRGFSKKPLQEQQRDTFEEASTRYFCLGARALGGWGGDLLGLGMPFSTFRMMVTGMEKSAVGFPYKTYP